VLSEVKTPCCKQSKPISPDREGGAFNQTILLPLADSVCVCVGGGFTGLLSDTSISLQYALVLIIRFELILILGTIQVFRKSSELMKFIAEFYHPPWPFESGL